MLIDLTPLRKHRDFRLLFIGQLISFLGSMVSYMAVPYQVYQLSHSNALVGALGLAQLLPVLIFGLLGGAYADRINRRRLISYMSGPLLGNARAGWVASLTSVSVSLWTGGAACIIAVVATSIALPKFWAYTSD
jgi:MFS family permease